MCSYLLCLALCDALHTNERKQRDLALLLDSEKGYKWLKLRHIVDAVHEVDGVRIITLHDHSLLRHRDVSAGAKALVSAAIMTNRSLRRDSMDDEETSESFVIECIEAARGTVDPKEQREFLNGAAHGAVICGVRELELRIMCSSRE